MFIMRIFLIIAITAYSNIVNAEICKEGYKLYIMKKLGVCLPSQASIHSEYYKYDDESFTRYRIRYDNEYINLKEYFHGNDEKVYFYVSGLPKRTRELKNLIDDRKNPVLVNYWNDKDKILVGSFPLLLKSWTISYNTSNDRLHINDQILDSLFVVCNVYRSYRDTNCINLPKEIIEKHTVKPSNVQNLYDGRLIIITHRHLSLTQPSTETESEMVE